LGVLEIDGSNRVTGYREKPEEIHHVSMGIYVYEPCVLPYIKRGEYLDFPDLVLRLIEHGETVCAFRSSGQWFDIGRPDDLARAQEALAKERGDDVVV
jgi:NDP-mannose synthase